MRAYKPEELFTRVNSNDIVTRIVQFPLVRMIIKMVMLLFGISLVQGALIYFGNLSPVLSENSIEMIWLSALSVLGGLIMLEVYSHLVEKRPLIEMNYRVGFQEFFVGFFIGVVLISLVAASMYLTGVLSYDGFNGWQNVSNFLGPWISAAFIEEFIFRGVLFKLSEEWLGTGFAILIQGAFFGMVHGGNPNASALSTFAIAFVKSSCPIS